MAGRPAVIDLAAWRPPEPLPGTLEHALWHALHGFAGAAERWDRRRAAGLGDLELRRALVAELGIAGGGAGPDTAPYYFRGDPPALWFDAYGPERRRPDLRGHAILARAREILDLPYPGRSGQGRLFR